MANAEKTAIPVEFRRLHSLAHYTADDQIVGQRWKGVLACIESLKSEHLDALLRTAFRFQGSDNKVLTHLRSKLIEADANFPPQDNDREMEILAICILMYATHSGRPIGEIAAQAFLTTAFLGARLPNSGDLDVVSFLDTHLSNMAKSTRARKVFDIGNIKRKKDEYDPITAKSTANDNPAAFDALGLLVRGQFNATVTALEEMSELIRIQDEELQILWWLLNGWSRDLSRAMEKLAVAERILVAGKELADMTATIGGVPAIKALLSRVGLTNTKAVTVADAIGKADLPWASMALSDLAPSPLHSPLHFAISRRVEVSGKDTWVTPWADATRIDPKRTYSAIDLAHQFYRERLVLTKL